jgi:hypothetical protein
MSDGGQALLEGLRVVAGDLLVKAGAAQREDIDRGGWRLRPARAPGGECLGLPGVVADGQRPDQEGRLRR